MNRIAFHGEYVGIAPVAAEADMRFALYENRGASEKKPLTLGPHQQVFITDLHVHNGATAQSVTLFDGPDNTPNPGEVIDQADYAANGGVNAALVTPHACRMGTYPKATGTAGYKVTIRGYIV